MEVKPQDIERVIQEALKRHKEGEAKYGSLNLSSDDRDFLKEAEQELLDCINYCVFQILRLRKIIRVKDQIAVEPSTSL